MKPVRTIPAFTLLEVMIASMIFAIVIVFSYSLYRYLINSNTQARLVTDLQLLGQSGTGAVEQITRLVGYPQMLDQYLDVGGTENPTRYRLIANPDNGKMEIVAANTNQAADAVSLNRSLFWAFWLSHDDSIGTYLQEISEQGGVYTLTFSGPLSSGSVGNNSLDLLLPCINNPSRSWGTASAVLGSDRRQILITVGPPESTTVGSGCRIKPSSLLTDSSGRSDVTISSGVALPLPNQRQKGYPHLVRLSVITWIGDSGISETTTTYLRAEL